MKNYISIGVTGGIGSGKSFICQIIESMGYPVFYSDQRAKDIITSDKEAVRQIKSLFGEQSYIGQDLNRSFLADQIFNDHSLREKMNDIVHPLVRKHFHEWAESSQSALVFNEAAILFETGSYKNFDKTILVTAPESLRIKRIQQRDQVDEATIKARMEAQWPDEKKIPLADFVINNNEEEPLLQQLEQIIEELRS